jgi:hypothetical protein
VFKLFGLFPKLSKLSCNLCSVREDLFFVRRHAMIVVHRNNFACVFTLLTTKGCLVCQVCVVPLKFKAQRLIHRQVKEERTDIADTSDSPLLITQPELKGILTKDTELSD